MISQLAALGLVMIAAVSFALYGMRQQRKLQKTQATDAQNGIGEPESEPRGAGPAAYTSHDHVQPVFGAFADEVGRVAEEGAAIHVALGSGGLLSEQGMVSVAALQSMEVMVGLSAAYDTPPFITTGDATLYLLADTQVRGAYARLGSLRSYRPTAVRFLAPSPLLYAAQAATLASDEALGTNINLGAFDQEVTFLTDAALRKNVKLYGGAASALGLAALYPDVSDDRLAMGEELFAGGAEVTGRSAFWASLWAENLLRWVVVTAIVIAVAVSLFGALMGSGG